MRENIPLTPKNMHNELITFVYERDSEFRTHLTESTSISRQSGKRVATVQNDDDNKVYEIYDSKTLTLTAERLITGAESSHKASVLFTLNLTTATKLDQPPGVLLPYLNPDDCTQYPGDGSYPLEEIRQLEYTIRNHRDLDDITLDHRINYDLCDGDIPLYTAEYPIPRNQLERVAVASEQRTLIVPPRITQELNKDMVGQVEYDVLLRSMRETSERPDFTKEEYEADAIFSIRALLKILRSSDPLPTTDDARLRKKFPKSSQENDDTTSDPYPYLF
jgi:hypothetical protein